MQEIRHRPVTSRVRHLADPLGISLVTHPTLVARLRKLARRGVLPAEARRLVVPLAYRLGLPPPSYSTVLRIVSREKARHKQLRAEPSMLDSLVLGRVPTPREAQGTLARALEHKGSSR